MKYIRIYKGMDSKLIEHDKLTRFLDAGWQEQTSTKKTTSKRKLKIAEPEVKTSTKITNEELVDQIKHSEQDLSEDNWTFSEDDFNNNEEN